MHRWPQAASALPALARNQNLRRVELAWGASIAAEWTHFVALGVFAYSSGGASAVGIAGLVRMLPAAFVAPFAAALGDRFRRERFLVVVSLAGSAALGGSAAAFYLSHSELIVFALAGVVGVTSTIFRPALQATLPSLARTPQELIASNGATSTFESLGTLLGPLVAGILVSVANAGVVFLVAAAALLVAAGLAGIVRPATTLQQLGRVLTTDVVLKLTDREVLGRHDPIDQVANRHHSEDSAPLLHNRQVTAALFRHAVHALIYRGPRVHRNSRAGHDLMDLHFL